MDIQIGIELNKDLNLISNPLDPKIVSNDDGDDNSPTISDTKYNSLLLIVIELRFYFLQEKFCFNKLITHKSYSRIFFIYIYINNCWSSSSVFNFSKTK